MVEVMVSAAIGSVVLGVLYSMFTTAGKIDRGVESKNELVQSATLAVETLKRDLEELVSLPVDPDRPRYGDGRNPVYISEDGRQISFYITAKGPDSRTPDGKLKLDRVNYHIRPAARQHPDDPVSYFLVRSQGSEGDVPQEASEAATGMRNLGAVYLEDIQFTMLTPFIEGVDENRHILISPDENFYVDGKLVATTSAIRMDGQGKKRHDTLEMRLVSPLEQPSQLARTPNVGIATAQVYEANPPSLKRNAENLVSLTPQESKAVADLQGLSDKFEAGSIPPAELEKQVREILKDILNNPRTPALSGPANPPDPASMSLDPNSPPGQPALVNPAGDRVVLPAAQNQSAAAPPAAAPAQPLVDATRTWQVTSRHTKKAYVRNPATGQYELVSSSTESAEAAGGETVSGTGMADVGELTRRNEEDMQRAVQAQGVAP